MTRTQAEVAANSLHSCFSFNVRNGLSADGVKRSKSEVAVLSNFGSIGAVSGV